MSDLSVSVPKLINHIAFVLDESGSMGSLGTQALATFNDYIKSTRESAGQHDQETYVSIYFFNSSVKQVFRNIPAQSLGTIPGYRPSGQTALFDAVAQAINDFKSMLDANSEHVSHVVIAITDGQENASIRYNKNALQRLLHEVLATERYTVAFLVPPRQSGVLAGYGVPLGNIREWDITVEGLKETAVQTRGGLNSFYAGRKLGYRSTTQFFTTNTQNLKPEEVKATCKNIADEVKVYPVNARESINTFYEREAGKAYIRGMAFYELTKKETIQPTKDVMIVNKTDKAIYTGKDARKLIGLPDFQEVKVQPGNHGDWDIFVQSTSSNRKLESGTRLICVK